jgi:two-component system response regulator DesR
MIRVLIAEDMHMIRGALVALLQLEPDIEVVAELERGDVIVETALRTKPDVAVVDIDLPGLDGLSAAGRRVLDPELVAAAVETGTTPLSDREADVLRSAESGLSTEDIGRHLNLSGATVRNYLSNAIGKLGARNRLDAIRIAKDAGWL